MRLICVFLLFFILCLNTIAKQDDHPDSTEKITLKEAINSALINNPEITSSAKEIDIASGKMLQAGRLPNAEFSLEVNEIPSGFDLTETGELDLNFSQQMEFFNKRNVRIQSAELQIKIAELNYERTKKLITSQVKKIYYNGLLSRKIVESIESNVNLLNDFLAQVTDRYQAGTSSYLDVIRAKVEISILKNDLFDAKKNYQQVTGQLKVLLGNKNAIYYELTDSLFYRVSGLNKDTVINFYSLHSNLLQIIEIQEEQSKSLLSLAKKNALPDFNFGLSFQNRNSEINGFDQYFGVNIGISLPMFYSGGVKGDILEAEANLSISDIRSRYAKVRASQNIRTAYSNLFLAEEQLMLFDTSLLKDIEDELQAGISAYQNGQIDLLNLFDIYRTYRAIKVEYARTVYNTLVALTDLEISSEVIE